MKGNRLIVCLASICRPPEATGGEMCAIAKASASMLFASIEGMTPAAIIDLRDEQILKALGGPIKRHRVKCALLPVLALRGAIQRGDDPATLS